MQKICIALLLQENSEKTGTNCEWYVHSAYFKTCRMAPFSMYQLFINIHSTCKDSPVTGLSVCPSGRGAFGSGLVATIK